MILKKKQYLNKEILIFIIFAVTIYSCKNRSYYNLDNDSNKNSILVHEKVKVEDFLFYDELLLFDEYEYPKTIVFKSRITKDLRVAIDYYKKENDYKECKEKLLNEYINFEEFASFYEMNESIQKSIENLKLPSDDTAIFVSLYSISDGIIFDCKNEWNGRLCLKYDDEFIYGILDLFGKASN